MVYTYEYPRGAITVDCVIFGLDKEELKILLIERNLPPFKGKWALPGGFVKPNESLDDAAKRELAEETGMKNPFLEQLYTFGEVKRDPRERVVTVAYYSLVNLENHPVRGGSDARSAKWFNVNKIPKLAFDHQKIFKMGLERIKGKVRYQPIGFELLPKKFTLTQVQKLYELILERDLDKRNFRKKFLSMDLVIDLNEVETGVAHRAAKLYKFDVKKYKQLIKQGFNFEI